MSKNKTELIISPKFYAMEIVKALIISLIASLLLVLLAAFVIKTFNISNEYIPIINQVIRSVSILIGALFSLKRRGNGWLRGIIFGLLYAVFAFIIFSLLGGGFTFDITLLNNVVISMTAGLISGIISMLIQRN